MIVSRGLRTESLYYSDLTFSTNAEQLIMDKVS